jgi:copper oxidase (laccase) domain-containing protein
MIAADQPIGFDEHLHIAVSSIDDGTMLNRAIGAHDGAINSHRVIFCQKNGLDYNDTVFQRIVYDENQRYDRIKVVTAADTTQYKSEVRADALITSESRVGLFLPVADCVATVIYDTDKHRVALLHLGRHSTLAGLMEKTLIELQRMGSHPENLRIWMAPSVQRDSYRLDYFDAKDDADWRTFVDIKEDGIYIDMQGYNQALAIEAGVKPDNIVISPVDTAKSPDYFSHSNGDTDGRFAVHVFLRD